MRRPTVSTRLRLAYVAAAALDTGLAGSSGPAAHRARVLTKPLLMPLLASSLAASPRAHGSPLRTGTLVAQGFGWGGDVALLRAGTPSFIAGAGSFGVGHLAYLSGFVRRRRRGGQVSAEPLPRALVVVWATSTPLIALGAAKRDGRLGAAVAGYSALLTAMVVAASRLDPEQPAAARRTTLAGAGLFLLSDTILGTRKFVLRNPSPRLDAHLERAVMATYTAGQLLLSEGAARAVAP